MQEKFLRELADAHLSSGPGPREPVTAFDLAGLPAPARSVLEHSGAIGRPRTWSFRAHWHGDFRLRPDRSWIPCEVWQYDTSLPVTRVFHMRLRFGGVVPLLVRDTYFDGHGWMRGRVLDTFSVVDESNEKIDTGELVTYLNDAILFAPSLLLGPCTTWTSVDDRSFDVALTDRGLTVRARVMVDADGRVSDFSTTDRFGTDPANPKEMIRARWTTPISGWKLVDGRLLPTGAQAIWHFPSGDFAYARFDFSEFEIELDVPPG